MSRVNWVSGSQFVGEVMCVCVLDVNNEPYE